MLLDIGGLWGAHAPSDGFAKGLMTSRRVCGLPTSREAARVSYPSGRVKTRRVDVERVKSQFFIIIHQRKFLQKYSRMLLNASPEHLVATRHSRAPQPSDIEQ